MSFKLFITETLVRLISGKSHTSLHIITEHFQCHKFINHISYNRLGVVVMVPVTGFYSVHDYSMKTNLDINYPTVTH